MRYFIISMIIFVFIVCVILINPKSEIQSANVKSFCDSIASINYEYENTINRYEITLQILREENPNLAKEFEEIMTTQTE